ncbi:hypothetical protein A2154_03775 [Candidatus Gottesmanbacteria bacterium RBG_16_43_7]|uniref:Glycosyltransferase 2-like domain-containing protein n=1 Tax=Candidatus Gottesmanbacteria bacterium RBG_16_43_7 TaxID=1798373 RepID=A0A1F5Z9W5_9BACT|nr:MAG: hypothetical protein A2154_03775 [Candidatus Gottesmanbacteria bacterium RBG_16_43_7]
MHETENTVFIIVTYQPILSRLNLLLKAVSPVPIVIVDNTDSHPAQLVSITNNNQISLPHNVTVISDAINHGYAAAINIALKLAFTGKVRWVVILNDDMQLTNSAVKVFINTLYKAEPSVAGPFAGLLDKKRWTTIYNKPERGLQPQQHPDYMSGEFFAIHHDVYRAIGNFYEPYFLYYEEVDYCRRAFRAGFKLNHIPVAGIMHDQFSRERRLNQFIRHYYLARNHLLFVERNAPISIKLHELVRITKTLIDHRRHKDLMAFSGVKDYIFRNFGKYKGVI